MSIFSSYKKIFLLGFIIVILLAIPLSVYIAQQRQKITSKAFQSTTLSFDPASATVKTGDILTLNVVLNPGTGPTANQVSFVKLSIGFDSSKFTTVTDSLVPNETSNTLKEKLEDAVYESGKASISLSVGADPTKVVTEKTKIAILKLKALSATDANNPSSITFSSTPNTQVLSIASSDKTSENVLSTTTPAAITITAGSTTAAAASPTPTPTATSATATASPTPTPNPLSQPSALTPTLNPFQITDLGAQTIPINTPTIAPQDLPIDSKGGLPPTGPTEKIIGIGIIGAILTIIGGAAFLML